MRSKIPPLWCERIGGIIYSILGIQSKKPRVIKSLSFCLAPQVGLEPTTLRLTAACSTSWAIEDYKFTSLALGFWGISLCNFLSVSYPDVWATSWAIEDHLRTLISQWFPAFYLTSIFRWFFLLHALPAELLRIIGAGWVKCYLAKDCGLSVVLRDARLLLQREIREVCSDY